VATPPTTLTLADYERTQRELRRPDGYTLRHVRGDAAEQARSYLTRHYRGTDGGAGTLIGVYAPDGRIVGACLIGGAPNSPAEHRGLSLDHDVLVCKRLYADDDSPVEESQILRFAMRVAANNRMAEVASIRPDAPRIVRRMRRDPRDWTKGVLCVSYAEPDAVNPHTGQSLQGWLYLAAGFFFAGYTQPRCAIRQANDTYRSTRDGKRTLGRKDLLPGEEWVELGPARIWVAPVVPEWLPVGHRLLKRAPGGWSSGERKAVLRGMPAHRRLAAQQWVDERAWVRQHASHREAIGTPRQVRFACGCTAHVAPDSFSFFHDKALARPMQRCPGHGVELTAIVQRLQGAYWRGRELSATAGPVWPRELTQQRLFADDFAGERTAGRVFLPVPQRQARLAA
jgi:hypothetical protein